MSVSSKSSAAVTACDKRAEELCPGALQILQAASELFAERGYEGVSVLDIAERAGVSKANVFHHFVSKEALYLKALREAALEPPENTEAVVRGPGEFPDKLHQLSTQILMNMMRTPAQTRLVFREVLEHGSSRGRALAEEVFRRNFTAELSLFVEAQRSGELRDDIDPVIAWMSVISANMMFFLCADVLRHNPEFTYGDDPELYVKKICDLLLRGLTAPERGAQ